jgi:hypothetical protein
MDNAAGGDDAEFRDLNHPVPENNVGFDADAQTFFEQGLPVAHLDDVLNGFKGFFIFSNCNQMFGHGYPFHTSRQYLFGSLRACF